MGRDGAYSGIYSSVVTSFWSELGCLEYAEKAYKTNPYNIEISINLARKYLLNKKYLEAIDVYLNLLKLNKKEAGYYYSISFLYEKLGDKEKSLDFIKKAIKIDDNNIKYKQFLSKILND